MAHLAGDRAADVDVVDAIFSSGRYPAGKLPYNKFHFEMQLLAPYAGNDSQAYLHKWREEFRAKVADSKAKKGEEKAKTDAILDAKKKADNAARVPPDSQLNPWPGHKQKTLTKSQPGRDAASRPVCAGSLSHLRRPRTASEPGERPSGPRSPARPRSRLGRASQPPSKTSPAAAGARVVSLRSLRTTR